VIKKPDDDSKPAEKEEEKPQPHMGKKASAYSQFLNELGGGDEPGENASKKESSGTSDSGESAKTETTKPTPKEQGKDETTSSDPSKSTASSSKSADPLAIETSSLG